MARLAVRRQTVQREDVHDIDPDTGEFSTDMRDTALSVQRGGFERGFEDVRSDRPAPFKVVNYVSIPMLEVPVGQTFFAQMVDKARVLPPIEGQKQKYKNDHVASTLKAPNGEVRLFTWNTVFRSEMERAYPEDGYVGKWFQITRLPVKRGKDYATFQITEVEPT